MRSAFAPAASAAVSALVSTANATTARSGSTSAVPVPLTSTKEGTVSAGCRPSSGTSYTCSRAWDVSTGWAGPGPADPGLAHAASSQTAAAAAAGPFLLTSVSTGISSMVRGGPSAADSLRPAWSAYGEAGPTGSEAEGP